MEQVLSIDATQSALRGGVLAIDDSGVRVVAKLPEGIPNPFLPATTEQSDADRSQLLAEAKHAIESLQRDPKAQFNSTVVIVEPELYLALNVTLPFKDARVIRKVIQPEVQDVVPFDIEQFVLSPQVTGPLGENQYDVIVQLIPRSALAGLVQTCKDIGIDPHTVGTPSSLLAALMQRLHPLEDGVLVLVLEDSAHFVGWVAGVVRVYKATPRHLVPSTDVLWNEAQLFRLSIAQRYGVTIDRVKIVSAGEISSLPAPGTLPWEPFDATNLVGTDMNGSLLSGIAARAVAGLPPAQISGNLRTGEFAFRAHRRELQRAWNALRWYLIGMLGLLVVVPLLVYTVRAGYLASLNETLHSQVSATLGRSDIPVGSEVDFLIKENARLEKLLRDLGSPTVASPLESFLEISGLIPNDVGADVKRINIKGTRVRVEGSAPDYSSVETMERIFKRNRRTFCRVKKETSQATGSRRGFAFDLWLCE